MYLKNIEIAGFKSFAKKSSLDFNSSITAVVGPNGSGKSNVAEAFRFVLGEQSIKSMRGKKGEDLIWNGSDGVSRAGRASVKVTFDNAGKLFDLDFSEVVIERAVNRDGSNEYRLNGSVVRLKDIFELLSRAHIGSSGHHIISQGEADKVLNASLKERKAIIEDALGLKLYQHKREESEKKLGKTFENLSQIKALRREIAPHLKFLKKQMDKIDKAEDMRHSLVSLAKTYFQSEETYIIEEKRRISEAKNPVKISLGRLTQELGEAKSALSDSAKADKKEYQVLDLEAELAGTRAIKDGLQRELGKVEGSLSAEERIIRQEEDLAKSEEHRTVRLKEVEDLYEEISLLSEVSRVIERVKSFIKERSHSTDSNLVRESRARIADLNREKDKIEKELIQAESQEKSSREKYESLKREIEQDKDSSRDAEKAVFRIMSEENELLSKKRLLESEETNLRLVEEEFKRELTEVAHLAGGEVLEYKTLPSDNSSKKSSGRFAQPDFSSESSDFRGKQEEHKREIQKFKIRLEDSGGGGSEEVTKEFKEVSERDDFLAREVIDLENSTESLKSLIKDLEERLSHEFSAGLKRINDEFSIFFKDMFGGGDAKLTLIKESKKRLDPEDLEGTTLEEIGLEEIPRKVEEGLDISVNLPHKKIRGLAMLSGGERALTSIALIFAVSQVNPPPFIILDETDAALDEANSRKYGDMVERLSKRSQLILITHNRETMSRAGTIYGVTMNSSSASKLLSIDFTEAIQVAK